MALIRKRFVQVDDRMVHYRVAGRGFPVVLLHESPRSSRSLVALLEQLGEQCRVIAPDTPGYGDSSPLPEPFPPLVEFSSALARFLDVMGVHRCVLYGSHTGGSIAADFAERYPTRVSGLILDGFAIFTDQEKRDMVEHYLPPFEPAWDGSHITSLWSRARDLFTYFPYHRRDPQHRISTELFSLDACYRTVLGFLEAGEHYRAGYRASITHLASESLRRITVPTSVVARKSDLLWHHLQRVPPDASCSKVPVSDNAGVWMSTIERLVKQYGVSVDAMDQVPADPWSDAYVDVKDRQYRIRRFGPAGSRPVLFLHDLPGSGSDASALSHLLGPSYCVIAPDLPGCADSDFFEAGDAGIGSLVEVLQDMFEASGIEHATLASDGASVIVGSALQAHLPRRLPIHLANELGTSYLSVPPESPRQLVPDSVPRLGGGHLTDAWFQIRDSLYYAPWNQRGHAHRRARDPEGRVELVQTRFNAWMKGPAVEDFAQWTCDLPTGPKAPDTRLADADDTELADAIKSLFQ